MRRRRLALPAPRRSSCSPGGALPGSRVCCAHGRVRAHGRAWRSRERGRDGGRALTRSVSSPRPGTRVWLCRWPGLTVDGGSLSRSRSPPSTPAACLTAPQRPAGVSPLSRPALTFRSVSGGWCASRPPSGEGERPASASRCRPLAVAPGRACRTEPASCEGSRTGASARRRSSLPRLPPPNPVRVPSYRVPARRFKDPRGGSPLRPRGRGGGAARREPSTSGGSRGLPFLTRWWVREPPLGRPWGSPPRARFAGASSVAGPVSVGPDPLS